MIAPPHQPDYKHIFLVLVPKLKKHDKRQFNFVYLSHDEQAERVPDESKTYHKRRVIFVQSKRCLKKYMGNVTLKPHH